MKTESSAGVLRIFCGDDITESDRKFIRKGFESTLPKWSLHFNDSGSADLVIVINFDPKFHWVKCPPDRLYKWLTEPVVDGNLSRRFSSRHSKRFHKVFSPFPMDLQREVISPPLFPPRLSQEFVERYCSESNLGLFEKSALVSTVTSTLNHLEGHIRRNELIDYLSQDQQTSIDVYGRGRREVVNKEDAMMEYMFSLCVENSFQGYYWSEKLTDAFLCLSVPIYIGAKEVSNFFPVESFIDASGLNNQEVGELISSLSIEDYLRRLPFLIKARQLVLNEYHIGKRFAEFAKQKLNETKPTIQATNTVDTFISLGLAVLEKIPFRTQLVAILKWLLAR